MRRVASARYLFRLANKKRYAPSDFGQVSESIRKILGSRDTATHFRISSNALEFNLHVSNKDELGDREKLLEKQGFQIIGKKLLDTPLASISREEAVKEGVELFNEERFWEAHEVLEQAWHVSKGGERDAIQSLILTAAAFVHYQKNELDICLSVLKRARDKIPIEHRTELLDLGGLRSNLDLILGTGRIRLFVLGIRRRREHDFSTGAS